jgi:predicted metal-dependent peptidase
MLAIGKQLTVEQRLSKAVVDIMGKAHALAGVIMIGERVVDDTVPTACTNGRDEKYGRAFVESLNDPELRFLILHEVYHKLYRHLTTWKHLYNQDAQLSNVACDHVINLKITDEFAKDGWVKMPDGGCFDVKYRGWDTAQVFKDLQDNNSGDDGEGGDGETNPMGTLPMLSMRIKIRGGFDAHDWEGAQDMSAEEQRELARDIDEAVRQGALIASKLGSGGVRNLEDLLQPQVDWREVLREFVQNTCAGSDYSTWKRPNRRYMGAGIYMPSGVSDKVGELVIAIDTSGSIGGKELTAFLSEVTSICETVNPDKVRLLYWDTAVCREEVYETNDMEGLVKSTKPAGGGGTDVECVPEYMQTHGIKPQACIVLTDGHLYGGWGTWNCPTLWCILDNDRAKPDVGVTVNIKSREM